MLDVLGLDLITYMQDDSDDSTTVDDDQSVGIVPDGIYHMARKLKRWNNKIAKGNMQVADGKYILLKGSDVCPNEGKGLQDTLRIRRNTANIVDNVLQEDVVFSSPSSAAVFMLGGAVNGWETWKTDEGELIDIFRNQ